LNENEDNDKIILKNKKLKTKIKIFNRHSIEIIKKVKNILIKINDNKKINLGEFKVISIQELNYKNGKYIGKVNNGLREGKGIMNYNNGEDMKMIGKMIKGKEKEYCILMMVIDMKVIIKIIKEKEKEYTIKIMVIDMKVIGKMIKLKEKEYFIVIMVLYVRANGKMVKLKGKVYFIFIMEIFMKVNLKILKEKEKE
jgi:hypothetical protein